ncbi:MAG: vWA domain-containing protein [Myxococcales bacterium]
MMTKPWIGIAALLSTLGLLTACGSGSPSVENPDDPFGTNGGTGNGGTSGTGSANGGTGNDINVGPGPGDGGSDGNVEPDPNMETCAANAQQVALIPLDMGLGVDTSYSMDFDDKWPQVRDALNVFAKNPNYKNMGVALQFFPVRQQCNVDQYGEPIVPMQVLPGVQPAFTAAIASQRMFGGTPLVQVMQGMVGYMRSWAKTHADRKPVLVLATDGIPDDTCSASNIDPSNSLDNALVLAKESFEGKPSIPVFVIGVGEELTALNAIAEAGGTKSAAVIATTGNVTEAFLAALYDIRKSALSCNYDIPAPKSGDIDYTAVNVTFKEGSSKPSTFFYVKAAADCELQPEQGWYYDDPKKPTQVVLCPKTCERVSAASDAKMDVAFGCKRNDVVR